MWRIRVTVAMVTVCLLVGCVADPPAPSTTSTPDTSPGPSAWPPGGSVPPVPVPFPDELKVKGGGHVYIETDEGVLSLDMAHRKAQLVATPTLDAFKSFVATPSQLVVKQVDDPKGFVVTNQGTLRVLPSEYGAPGRIYAGVRNTLWIVPEETTNGLRILSRFTSVDTAPRLLNHRELSDSYDLPDTDSAGALLTTRANIAYVVTPRSTKRISGWRKGWKSIGIGPTAVLVRTCRTCDVTQRSREASLGTKMPATAQGLKTLDRLATRYDSDDDGLISADGRFVAITVSAKGDNQTRVVVVDLATGRMTMIPGTLARFNANDQFAWLNPTTPILLAVTDRQLSITNPRTGEVRTWDGMVVDRVAVTY